MSTLVSLIIPIYNVEDYIDKCLESVTEQTHDDLEIILINDGSTDGSGDRCRCWERRDPRIRFIDRPHEGVSAARNLGITLARGDVVGFVDADDWIDSIYVEKLLAALEAEDADYAECDIWRYDNRTGKQIYRSCGSRAGVPYTLREHMRYGPTATYKALSRKSLWGEYDIRMPSCSFESPAVYSLILALSKRIAYVPEALYHYRRFRSDSLIESGYGGSNELAIEAMDFLIGQFKKHGIYEDYREDLEGIVKYRLSDILATQFHRKPEDDYKKLVQNYRHYLERSFPDGDNEKYIIFGGYNLNRILLHTDMLQDPYCRFNFSSIVSVTCDRDSHLVFEHSNRYRRIMMNRESEQSFWTILGEIRPDHIFMDLIEERFDLIEHGGSFYTMSDAFLGSDMKDLEGEVIERGSDRCDDLWKQSFERFIARTGRISPGTEIIVVENYLSERVGDVTATEEFGSLKDIRRANSILKRYYDHIRYRFDTVKMVKTDDLKYYFTDERYEYGAVPSHLNEIVNQEIAERLMEIL